MATRKRSDPIKEIERLYCKREMPLGRGGLNIRSSDVNALEFVVEGGDGTGKSTVCSLLYKIIQEEGITVRIIDDGHGDPFFKAREDYRMSHGDRVDSLSLFLVKCGGRRAALIQNASQLEEPRVHIYDRSVLTPLVEYIASILGNGEKPLILMERNFERVAGAIRRMERTYRCLPQFVLDCDAPTATQRITERYRALGQVPQASEDERVLKLRRAYFAAFANVLPDTYLINTENRSPADITDEIMGTVRKMPKYKRLSSSNEKDKK